MSGGTKESQVMAFLHDHVFDPVLQSSTASEKLKQGIRLTIIRMNQRDARGMVSYYWAAMHGTDRSIPFADLMRAEGFTRFEEVIEDFRVQFDDHFLRS